VRQVATRKLVLALCAGFNTLEPVRNRIIDGLIVTELEVQERVVLGCPPVAAIERVSADEIDRSSDPSPGAACHHKENTVAHFLANDGKEIAGQVGPAPFA
jgi:hypothetical protein